MEDAENRERRECDTREDLEEDEKEEDIGAGCL
jgi:hypothetical protein